MIQVLLSLISLSLAQTNSNDIGATWKTAPNVVDFQPFAEKQVVQAKLPQLETTVTLTNLNTHINTWFLLDVKLQRSTLTYNLENTYPRSQTLTLLPNGQLELSLKNGPKVQCDLLGSNGTNGEAAKAQDKDPYVALCDERVYLKNHKNGQKGNVELATTTIRSLFGDTGDSVVNFVKETYYDGAFYEAGQEGGVGKETHLANAPNAAEVSEKKILKDHKLGFVFAENVSEGLTAGQWYAAKNYPGVYLSAMKAKFVDKKYLNTFTDRVSGLDARGKGETEAMIVSVGMDLSKYAVGFDNGTEYPGVGWSPRAVGVRKDNSSGPDGFSSLKPLNFPGVVKPDDLVTLVGTFAGGFQRRHSAFKSGPLSKYNKAHHYGVMEKGVLMSTLVPNLATVIMYNDGNLDLKTWEKSDEEKLSQMKDVRQNGVPLIENYEPGTFVSNWGAGNWSGSAEAQLKTPRTSVCLIEQGSSRYLMLSYFSSHTPNAMARVLQSYHCKYAVHLDMNHPKFAYAAFFHPEADGGVKIEHLHQSMAGEDVKANGERVPRSILTPTYKDFFYVMKKEEWLSRQ